ncbi:unnamed protein product [Symbiodinium microadriaticum]|nr:unnamed protein product [Symbiodinium microadriaticum]
MYSRIPTPMEVLRMQAAGERVVTMFLTKEELSSFHVAKLHYMSGQQLCAKDAVDFLVHDLHHMDHFTDPSTRDEQVGFFRAILGIGSGRPKQFFRSLFPEDDYIWFELEYLVSDMNCYVPHLMKYLLAKLINAVKRKYVAADRASNGSGEETSIRGDIDGVASAPFLAECLDVWTRVVNAMGIFPNTATMKSAGEYFGQDEAIESVEGLSGLSMVVARGSGTNADGDSYAEQPLRVQPCAAFQAALYLLLDTHSFREYFSGQIPQSRDASEPPTFVEADHHIHKRLNLLKCDCNDVTAEIAGESLRGYFMQLCHTSM